MVGISRSKLLIGLFLLVLSRVEAHAEVMFEGYYMVRAGSAHVGYIVSRYEFDAKKNHFTSTYFLKTNEQGGNLTESLKATANDKFQPISFQYTTKQGETMKMIDAKVSKDLMTANVSDGKVAQNLKAPVKKGTFLASFLGYLMLTNGYKVDKKFVYSAIAEEDGATYSGEATIKAEEEFKGQKVFRILNKFKGSDFVSFVTPKGEILGTSSPLQSISTELVAVPAEATKGFIVPTDTLKLLFGSVPTGAKNVIAGRSSSAMPAAEPPAPAPAPSVKKALPTKPGAAETKPPPNPESSTEPSIPGEPTGK